MPSAPLNDPLDPKESGPVPLPQPGTPRDHWRLRSARFRKRANALFENRAHVVNESEPGAGGGGVGGWVGAAIGAATKARAGWATQTGDNRTITGPALQKSPTAQTFRFRRRGLNRLPIRRDGMPTAQERLARWRAFRSGTGTNDDPTLTDSGGIDTNGDVVDANPDLGAPGVPFWDSLFGKMQPASAEGAGFLTSGASGAGLNLTVLAIGAVAVYFFMRKGG